MLCMCINVLLYVFCPYGHLYKYLWLFNQFNSMASFNEANIFKCSGLFIIEKLKKYKESVNFTKRKASFFSYLWHAHYYLEDSEAFEQAPESVRKKYTPSKKTDN